AYFNIEGRVVVGFYLHGEGEGVSLSGSNAISTTRYKVNGVEYQQEAYQQVKTDLASLHADIALVKANIDLTELILRENNMTVKLDEFDKEMQMQKERAR
ncbi:hypothetical protein D0T50_13700, partial [Bacteroides sp. 214]|uniref:hypothetical protein n=1 Tax=Bacteroides sp. 214 TaxID=2302935 RepID=UPI0013D2C0F9